MKWNNYSKIYTNVCKLHDGLTGAAFNIPKFKINKGSIITPVNIMTAKLTAIILALQWIEDYLPVSEVL